MSNFVINPYKMAAACTQEYVVTNTATGTGWGTNGDRVNASKSTATVSEGDLIETLGEYIHATNDQPYNLEFVAWTDGGAHGPDEFICMTESKDVSSTGWIESDVVNGSGSVEAHTITAGEAGYIWLGVWADGNTEAYVDTGKTAEETVVETYNSSNTVEPTSPFDWDHQIGASIRCRATVCAY